MGVRRLQRALEEELQGHFVDVVVRGVAGLQLPTALALQGVEKCEHDRGLTYVFVSELRAQLASPVRRFVNTFEGELGLGGRYRGARRGEVGVQLLHRRLLDGADDGDERGVERHVHNEVLTFGRHVES